MPGYTIMGALLNRRATDTRATDTRAADTRDIISLLRYAYMKTLSRNILAMIAVVVVSSFGIFAQVPDREKVIAGADRAFEKASKSATGASPGCAVGVSLDRKSVFERAYGLAELEHSIPNTAETIFESGSVAKQFVAASLALLSLEGKLSIDDPVRKYIPELPDYGAPMTIRHLLNHTAGLRDWGAVMGVTGVGRGNRVVSQDLAFDIITHQKGIDFKPGAEYSYSNSGYTLAATIVERVSKQSLPEFTSERFFKPLGMNHSSWRDDYQRLVPQRAQAYSLEKGGSWRLNMPIMNVYGNGGMLTTVGDWLKWNAMLESRSMGAPLVEAMETKGVLNDGRKISYALGLVVNEYNELRQVSHGGSTAGYQTYLTRFPELKLSVAVLCNAPSGNPARLALDVINQIAGPFPAPSPPESIAVAPDKLQKYTSLYRNESTHYPARVTLEDSALRLNGRPLIPKPDGSFNLGNTKVTFNFGGDGKPVSAEENDNGGIVRFIAEPEWKPTKAELNSFAGEWYSDEAGATYNFVVEGEKAYFVQRPKTRLQLRPQYKDHFTIEGVGAVIWFTRDGKGKIEKLHVGTGRMRDLEFASMSGHK